MERIHKVKVDYGVADYYEHYRNTVKNPVDRHLYSKVLRAILYKLGRKIVSHNYLLRLPFRMGGFMLVKWKPKTKIIDGKVVTQRPVDYKATKDLWASNPKAKESKVVIFHENFHSDGYVFKVKYLNVTAIYKNRSYYKMQINRQLKREIAQKIKTGTVDSIHI